MTTEENQQAVARYKAYKTALNITPDDETGLRRELKKAIYKAFDLLIEQQELIPDEIAGNVGDHATGSEPLPQ